ncbi:MAG: alanine racemase, partial [Saprospiraceae bacterium]
HAGGRIQGDGSSAEIALWAYDTRLPFRESEACFVALAGPHRSGAAFVEQAHQRGVRLFCVSESDSIDWKSDATYWIVDDVLEALQRLAKAVRIDAGKQLDHVIGITGSNGKTIVKEWLYTLLGGSAQGVYRSPASFNSQLGVALSILHLPSTSRIAIFEAGISRAGEMEKLEDMIRPSLGVLTNIGSAHDAGFSGSEEKIREKTSLFKRVDELVYQLGNDSVTRCLNGLNVHESPWSQDPNLRAICMVTFDADRLSISQLSKTGDQETLEFPLPFTDSASRENLTNAVLVALQCGESPEKIRQRIPALQQADLRLSLTTGRQGCRLIDDTYNADIEGLEAALQFFSQHVQPNGQRILVLGPLLESGMDDQTAAQKIGQLVGTVEHDQLLLLGAPLKALSATTRSQHFESIEELESYLFELDLSAATILIKGPRALQLERISRSLQRQTHPVRLEINLDALAQNLAIYRSRLQPKTKICVMIKASAYGSGSVELVRFFEQRGIDYLAVANVDEGVELRKAGTTLPIIVANAQRAEFSRMVEYRLDAEVTSLPFLKEIRRSGHTLKLHLKMDTGMHRLGFKVGDGNDGELPGLLEELRSGVYQIESVFSHLIASNLAAGDEFSRKQNSRLEHALESISKAIGYRPMAHLLNSSGTVRLPEFQHDMVRLGIGLYGVDASPESGFAPAHRLLAQVVQIKQVKAGGYVGYGLRGQADADRTIGVINIGYADGLRRQAGHGAYALTIAGSRYPTVGSICMDFCMIDLSNNKDVVVGDEVEVFGETAAIGELAAVFDTIPYEVLTGIGKRVQRVYYR